MKRILKQIAFVLALILCAGLFAACGNKSTETRAEAAATDAPKEDANAPKDEGAKKDADAPAADSGEKVTLLLAAAASLEKSFVDELIPLFMKKNPDITVEGTYDSSGKLQTQIEEGLQAGVFMSAAVKQMNALVGQGLINREDVVELLENEVVLITYEGSGTAVSGFENIGDAKTIAIGDPASVPVGQYTEKILTSLGIWEDISARASKGTNVTEVLNQVAEGSAEVGIVYATDAAQIPDKVKVIAAAPEGSLKEKVIYPVAVLKDAPEAGAAKLFVEFLQTKEALDIFAKNGFKQNSGN